MNKQSADSKLISTLFFRLLPVQILLVMIGAVNGIVSSLFASNYVGGEAMAAIGLYAPVTMLLSAISTMFVGGSQIVCGKYMGKNQVERTQNVFMMDLLIMAAVSAVIVFVLLFSAMTDLTRVITSDEGVRRTLNRYILGQVIGIPALLLGQQFSAFLSLENQSKRTTAASVVYIAANIALNFLFVAVLGMGALGLALASSLGLWVFLAVQLQYYFTGKSVLRLSLAHFSPRDASEIVRTGYTGAINNGYQALRGFIVNALILQFVGAAGISAYAAQESVLRIFWAIPSGMQAVFRMLASVSIGEEDRQSLADTMRVSLFKCVPLMCCVSAALALGAVPLTRLFFRNPAEPVYYMTVMAFRIIPMCMPLSIILLQFSCYAQASGRQLLIHILSALDGVVCVAGFTALLIPRMGMNGCYLASVLNGVVCAVVIVLYSCIARKAFPKNMEELMVIPDDFGAPEDARIDISVRNLEEVPAISEQVIDFCRGRGIDGKRACFAGLCLEEMAGNVLEHGFKKDKKKHSVDIRVVHKDDDVILRIKDDCVAFNPAERQDIADPVDRMKGVGIRLVYKIAKDIKYQNILGLNVLTIRT